MYGVTYQSVANSSYVSLTPLCECDIHALLSKSLWLYRLESGWTWGCPEHLKAVGLMLMTFELRPEET